MKSRRVTESKFLSLLLRHKPEEIGLRLDEAGWASIDDIVQLTGKGRTPLTRAVIEEITATSDKQRFVISADRQKIRANQGHSLSIDLGLTARPPPQLLYHGTATRLLGAILEQGLLKRKRQPCSSVAGHCNGLRGWPTSRPSRNSLHRIGQNEQRRFRVLSIGEWSLAYGPCPDSLPHAGADQWPAMPTPCPRSKSESRLLQLRPTQGRSHRRAGARICLPLPRLPAPDRKRLRRASTVSARGRHDLGSRH